MNVGDSEIVVSIMQQEGYRYTDSLEEADIVLINTCSIRDNAEQRIWGRLSEMRRMRKQKPSLIIGNTHSEPLRQYIINDMERGGTYIKASGMYSKDEKEMIFLVVSRREVAQVQRKIREIDPTIFLVVTDAYDTYGEGFKPFPEKDAMLND
jgi:tRNA A37 methylthiotransferase MiaB